MKRKLPCLIAAVLLPMIGMLYLYNQNARYMSFLHVLIMGLALMVVSLIGYMLLRLLFRSDASALAGCLLFWLVMFVWGKPLQSALSRLIPSVKIQLLMYGALAWIVVIGALLFRRYKGDAVPTIALVMSLVLLLMNLVPAVRDAASIAMHPVDESLYKREFVVDEARPSPNVYWIHSDGMLGFDAVERYYGDEQREFQAQLESLGFQVNRSAMFESCHRTAIAVPSLMSPYFYDHKLAEILGEKNAWRTVRGELPLLRVDTRHARENSELMRSFKQKGYQTQTVSNLSIYFPPLTDRTYEIASDEETHTIELTNPRWDYWTLTDVRDLIKLIKDASGGIFPSLLERGQKFGLIDTGVRCTPAQTAMPMDEEMHALFDGTNGTEAYVRVFESLYDSIKTREAPIVSVVFFPAAHHPYIFDEDGHRTKGDTQDLRNYLGTHRFAAKMLTQLARMILENDPDAVIVIQADHGLHLEKYETLKDTFGEDAVLPLWNQVMSAIRVPEQYRDADLARTMDTPLNMSRYLMNRFVGEQYEYLAP